MGDNTTDTRMEARVFEAFEAAYVVEPNCGCWLWTKAATAAGYGQLRRRGRTLYAHRLSYEHFIGPIGAGLYVCHRCDVPACVNPGHLFLGTVQDNCADMRAKGRSMRGSRNHRARLTADDVRGIRAMVDAGHRYAEVAAVFAVRQNNISRIVNRLRWQHVA